MQVNKKRPLQIVTLYYIDGENNAEPRAKYQRTTQRSKTGIVTNVRVRLRSHEDYEKEYDETLVEKCLHEEPIREEIVYTAEETESIIHQYEQRQKDYIDIESTNLLETPVDTPKRLSIDREPEKSHHLELPPKIDMCLPSTSYVREYEFMEDSRIVIEDMPRLLLESLPPFTQIESNLYSKKISIPNEKKAVRCICNQTIQELKHGFGCDSSCLNRKLRMECPNRCPSGDFCTNKRLKKSLYAKVVTDFIGSEDRWGLFAEEIIENGQFIIEFIGEVITSDAMQNRKELYAKKPGHKKTYYLGLKNGFYIDATSHGNSSRFINQSDSPNSELQTWVVDRHLRLGFFAIKTIHEGDEITCNFNDVL
uniref:SET domain-containing protein n=1 Tax=Acrobeloides nanus TaxID=290746 RepID=A0A914DB62_9BILA